MPNEAATASDQISFGFDLPDSGRERLIRKECSPVFPRPDLWIKLSRPKPTEVFPTYWHFATLRQNVFFARVQNNPDLMPKDPIISRFKFTNAYRASDRVSQYLINHVIYDQKWSREDTFFRILLFKLFNKIETWESLKHSFGEITWSDYSFEHYSSVLSKLMDNGERIYSAAYIMPSGRSAFGYERKHLNHLKLLESMMIARLPDRVAQMPDLESVYRLLREFPCIGPFTGYQYTIDLNYSELVNFSENDFVEAGPGALDGIAKCFSDLGDYHASDIIRYMTDSQEDAFKLFDLDFRSLWGRPLHLIDCQNLFCEVDKYARVAHPDVTGLSGRTRIKQAYKASPRNLETPKYPPKWGLDTQRL